MSSSEAEISVIVEEAVESISEELRDLSLQIHSRKELSGEEHFGHKILTEYLEDKGFSVTKKAYGLDTAFRAEWTSGTGQGRTVSFNSEYDALPGIGHACGHNLIAISGVAAAFAVMTTMKAQNIPGKVVLFGTPAEEKIFGKADMVKAGAYQDVDVCLMVHPASLDTLEGIYLANQPFTIEYFGKPSHAAAKPWEGRNALDAMILAFNSVALLRQQTLTTNRIHGIITKGGDAPNVIPHHTSASFIIRSRNRKELSELSDQISPCFDAAATATGCTVKIVWSNAAYDVLVNKSLADKFIKYMKERGVPYTDSIPPGSYGGSTDMGNVSYRVPSIHSVYNIETTEIIHTPPFEQAAKTEQAHKNTIRASKCLALTALDVLLDNAFYEKVCEDFKQLQK